MKHGGQQVVAFTLIEIRLFSLSQGDKKKKKPVLQEHSVNTLTPWVLNLFSH